MPKTKTAEQAAVERSRKRMKAAKNGKTATTKRPAPRAVPMWEQAYDKVPSGLLPNSVIVDGTTLYPPFVRFSHNAREHERMERAAKVAKVSVREFAYAAATAETDKLLKRSK